MDLKTALKKISIFTLGLLCIQALIHFIPIDKSNYFAAIKDKHAALKSSSNPRVIIAGGSNVAFGFDSGWLSNEINLPVINMGLHGALGLKFILNDIFPYIHKGDILLLVPEYFQFYNNNYKGFSRTLSELLDTYPAGIVSLDLIQFFNIRDEYFPRLRSKLLRLNSETEKVPYYNRYMFNQFGDAIIATTPAKNISNAPLIKDTDIFNPQSVFFLNNYYENVKKKGGEIYFIYPASRKINCMAANQKMQDLDMKLHQILEIPILSAPLDSCLEEQFFFDTEYHLNQDGIKNRMVIIKELISSIDIVG